MSPQFRVAYDGATEYVIDGITYSVRSHQARTIRQECQADSDRWIGTVRAGSSHWHDYPPESVMQYFPGYVRARYRPTGETYTIDTTCGPIEVNRCRFEVESPPRVESYWGGVRAVAWRENMEAAGVDVG